MNPIPVVAAWLAVAITPVVLPRQASRSVRCHSIQYRFVDAGASMAAPHYWSVRDGRSYALRDSIVVDGRGIAEIQVRQYHVGTDTTWDVIARLTPDGTSAMAAASAHNLGQTMAVLLGDTIIEHGNIAGVLGSVVPVRLGAARREADSVAVRARRASGASCQFP